MRLKTWADHPGYLKGSFRMDTRCEVAKSGMRKLALVGIASACLWASAANSATISIAIGAAPVLVAGPNAGVADFLRRPLASLTLFRSAP